MQDRFEFSQGFMSKCRTRREAGVFLDAFITRFFGTPSLVPEPEM